MPFKFNPFTGQLDQVQKSGVFIPTYASDPSSPTEGEVIYNSTDAKIRVYLAGGWHDLHWLNVSPGSGVDNLLLESGDELLLESSPDDVLVLQ